MTPPPGSSGTSTSTKTQGETWRTGGALTEFLVFPSFLGTSISSKTPGRDFEDRKSLDMVPDVGFG